MDNRKPSKNSILGASVLNFIKSYVNETTCEVKEGDEGSGGVSVTTTTMTTLTKSDSEIYRSPLASHDERELSMNTNLLQIDDKLVIDEQLTCPQLLFKAQDEFQVMPIGSKKENFLKGCKWSPDGTCILTNSNDFTLRIFDTTPDLIKKQIEKTEPVEIKASLKLRESGGIYDFAWYPLMNAYDPATACIFSTSKDNPIHLFDAYTGLVRCSYQGYNHLDELVNAYSIAFNPSVSKLYCGYNKCIKVFDIHRPGKNYRDIKAASDECKIPGIISCISFSPIGCYAAGSYTKYIGVYIEENNSLLCMLQGHAGGLTHLWFSPDGNYLYSGGRKDPEIQCWDMRNPGRILQVFKRNVVTNQRIYFDIDSKMNYLCSGNDDGKVSMWNATDFSSDPEKCLFSYHAHSDCVNGVSFHPTLPVLATTSGQRKITLNCSSGNSSSSDESDEPVEAIVRENSLKIWNLNKKRS